VDHTLLALSDLAKAIKVPSRDPTPQTSTDHCLQTGCQKGRKGSKAMTRCCLCFRWFHDTCVGIGKDEDDVGFWPCPNCRVIGQRLSQMEDAQMKLQELNGELLRLLSQQVQQCTSLQEQLCKLQVENERLKMRPQATLSPAKTYAQVAGRVKPAKVLLLGSSLVRSVTDVTTQQEAPVRVHKHSGATFQDLCRDLDNRDLTADTSELILVCGTREADCDSALDSVSSDIDQLLSKAKEKCTKVTVSSVLPRTDKDVKDRTDSINTLLKSKCLESDVRFVDQDQNFRYADGSVDKSSFVRDGVHLSWQGTQKLIGNLGLKLKKKSAQEAHHQPTAPNHRPWLPQNQQRIRRGGNATRETQIRCFYCAEPGHTRETCGHGRPVKCNSCHRMGHKAKYCFP